MLPADVLLNCSQAAFALLISSWNVVLLHCLQGSLIEILLATSPSRKHVRKQSDYATICTTYYVLCYFVYKQAELVLCATLLCV